MGAPKNARTTVVSFVVFFCRKKTVENPPPDPLAFWLQIGGLLNPFRSPSGAAFVSSARRLRVAGFASGEAPIETPSIYAERALARSA